MVDDVNTEYFVDQTVFIQTFSAHMKANVFQKPKAAVHGVGRHWCHISSPYEQ